MKNDRPTPHSVQAEKRIIWNVEKDDKPLELSQKLLWCVKMTSDTRTIEQINCSEYIKLSDGVKKKSDRGQIERKIKIIQNSVWKIL